MAINKLEMKDNSVRCVCLFLGMNDEVVL